MEREPHRPNYEELRKAHEEAQKERQREEAEKQRQQEATRPNQVRAPGWTAEGGMEAQQRSALEYNAWVNQHTQERKEERREVTNAPEAAPKIEHENRPEESRQETRTADAGTPRGDEAKKAEEQEFDMKRFMSDPDYRRQMKEQRQAEQRERTEDRNREGSEHAIVADHQR